MILDLWDQNMIPFSLFYGNFLFQIQTKDAVVDDVLFFVAFTFQRSPIIIGIWPNKINIYIYNNE